VKQEAWTCQFHPEFPVYVGGTTVLPDPVSLYTVRNTVAWSMNC